MTIQQLKSLICTFLNQKGLGVPFIVAPFTSAAPVGTYIAVNCLSVKQDGSIMQMSPNISNGNALVQNVANLALYEVEGDGDILRRVRNLLQLPEFIDFLAKNDVTIWGVGEIIPLDTYDGDFHIRQWVFDFYTNFEDKEILNKETILSVDDVDLKIK